MRIAFLGTRGVPAAYGGFETAVEEIGRRLVENGHRVIVYCRHGDRHKRTHLGMELVHLPTIPLKATDTLVHALLSSIHVLVHRVDAVILMNAANAPLILLLRLGRLPVALHVDGLESKRGKWGRAGRHYYRACEIWGTRWANKVIADSRAIQKYLEDLNGVLPVYIPYGVPDNAAADAGRIAEVGLEPRGFHLVVARLEPENNVHLIAEGFSESQAKLPLVVVGSAPYNARYVAMIEALAARDYRIRLLGSIWDQSLLRGLYANALTYLHGHSVGGTNPSLLNAMGLGAPAVAYDVEFNREVAGETAIYFTSKDQLVSALAEAEASQEDAIQRGARGREYVRGRYDWGAVAASYERLVGAIEQAP